MNRSFSADQLPDSVELPQSDTSPILGHASYLACLGHAGLTPLSAVPASGFISVLGSVVSISEPKKTNGQQGHRLIKVQLTDPTISANPLPITYMIFCSPNALPPALHSGDIVHLREIKCQKYNGWPQLLKNRSTTYDIFSPGTPADGDNNVHRLVRYLRTACMPVAARTSSGYHRLIADMRPGVYGDVAVEVLSIEQPQTSVIQNTPNVRCLVTDYSENPSLPCDRFASVPGSRVIPCDFNNLKDIPKMPKLSVGDALWLRNCSMLTDPDWGVRLSVSINPVYPRTLIVKPLTPEIHGASEFMARKRELTKAAADADYASDAVDAADVDDDNENYNDNAAEDDAEDLPDATKLSDVCASSKVNVRYRVRATVTKAYPSTTDGTLVDPECRAILELSDTDNSAKCLAFFLATTPPSLLELLHMPADSEDVDEAKRRISRILATPRKVDLVVAACLVPGPHDIPTRCLLIEKFISPI
ncbi:hypothetical protein LPJ53_002679 [Coemansia erecta]|uniref:Telomeric single stranded DNA binding POT1/Cdc13 domain-containing protein n=1 Tax=Coemansia erecta TaxID=147472 RepID=A0A9W8CRM5_9FUNG|nr:hypothetical protein LPJ53_002679 [Coemansia erecta]